MPCTPGVGWRWPRVKPDRPSLRSALSRAGEFLGLRRSIVGLLGMVVLVGMGEHMAEQFLPLYLVALGGGFISVGFLNGMDNLLGALYAFPGGYLADRLGTKRALLVFNVLSMIGFPRRGPHSGVAGRDGRGGLVPLLDGHLPAGDHGAGRPRPAQEQADDGRVAPLARPARPHGPGAGPRRGVHRPLGSRGRGAGGVRRRAGAGGRGGRPPAGADRGGRVSGRGVEAPPPRGTRFGCGG